MKRILIGVFVVLMAGCGDDNGSVPSSDGATAASDASPGRGHLFA